MTGVADIIQLVEACIGITEAIILVGKAAQNAHGLPDNLAKLFIEFPAVKDLFGKFQESNIKEADEKNVEAILNLCHEDLSKLKDLFEYVCPKEGDHKPKRVWKAGKSAVLGKNGKLAGLWEDLEKQMKILEQMEILKIGKSLENLTALVGDLADEYGGTETFVHNGDGSQNNNTGSGVQNNQNVVGNRNTFNQLTIHTGSEVAPIGAQCLESLAFPGMTQRGDIAPKADDTCLWFLEDPNYQAWAESGGLLFVQGRAGAGKSTLMLSMVRDAEEQSTSNMLVASFFFHRRGSELQKTALGLLRSLLYQILSHDGTLLSRFVEKTRFEKRSKSTDWTTSDLWPLLPQYIQWFCERHTLRIYVDALDECSEDAQMESMAALQKLCEAAQGRLRLCVSCRPYPKIVSTWDHRIVVESGNETDITTYLDAHIRTGAAWRADVDPEMIKHLLSSHASGVFQWIVLVTRRVLGLQEQSLEFILDEVRRIPPDLADLYEDMLRQLSDGDRRLALPLLRWIAFAKRTMTLTELRYAVATHPNKTLSSARDCEKSEHWCKDDDSLEARLNYLSQGLVGFVTPYGEHKRCVQFDHVSVQEFIIERGISFLEERASNTLIGSVPGRAHYLLSRVCIRHLGALSVNDKNKDRPKIKSPFVDYARFYLMDHAVTSEAHGTSQQELIHLTEWPIGQPWIHWGLSLRMEGSLESITLQHIAAYLGLRSVLKELILRSRKGTLDYLMSRQSREWIDVKDSKGNTPLFYAARSGRATAVKLLIESGKVNVDSRNTRGETPLHQAAYSNNREVMELLLNTRRVDVNSKDIVKGKTPLHKASLWGNEAIITLLLNATRINVNSKDKGGKTPLHGAAERGRSGVMRLLLDTGKFDVDSGDDDGKTPLRYAVTSRFVEDLDEVVKLLLGTGKVDVNWTDSQGTTLLFWAFAANERDVIPRLLLDTGKVNETSKAQLLSEGIWKKHPHYPPIKKAKLERGRLDAARVLEEYSSTI